MAVVKLCQTPDFCTRSLTEPPCSCGQWLVPTFISVWRGSVGLFHLQAFRRGMWWFGLLSCSECREVSFAGGVEIKPRACSHGCAFFAVPSASSHLTPTTPGLVCLSTIPTVPAIATTMTLTWDLTAMVALAVSTVTVGTLSVSPAHSMASCGAGIRAAFRTGATLAPLCAMTPS